jgi:hypothetical protein
MDGEMRWRQAVGGRCVWLRARQQEKRRGRERTTVKGLNL